MPRLLFEVVDSFEIAGRGLVPIPGIVPQGEERFRVGDPLELVRPDGTRLRTHIAGLELFSPMPADHAVALLLPKGLSKLDVPTGTQVWSVD
jgi:hypothetical protein